MQEGRKLLLLRDSNSRSFDMSSSVVGFCLFGSFFCSVFCFVLVGWLVVGFLFVCLFCFVFIWLLACLLGCYCFVFVLLIAFGDGFLFVLLLLPLTWFDLDSCLHAAVGTRYAPKVAWRTFPL